LEVLATFIVVLISRLGYAGIILAMAIESACIPLPSEVIMPFSGFLVAQGKLNFWLVVSSGALGCLIGSLLAWWVGKRFGEEFIRQLIRRWGKYVLVFEYELDEAIDWFDKHGSLIVFSSRLLPIVRTFISLPAGIAEMKLVPFALYTFVGSFIWSAALAFIGVKLGENWSTLGQYFHKFDLFIALGLILATVYYFSHKVKKHRRWKKDHSTFNPRG
jgi:membrane protein DedA with SNARE-associated domain